MPVEIEPSKRLSAPEKEILRALTRPDATVEVIIPEDIDPKEWLRDTKMVCDGIDITKKRSRALIVALGRLLFIARKNPEIVAAAGYETWKDFLEGKIQGEFGVERSTCYDAEQIATRWGFMQVADVVEIGRRKMKFISQCVEEGKEGGKQAQTLLEKAKTMSESQLREFCVEKGWVDKGESQGAYIKIGTSKAIADQWDRFVSDERIQAAAGSGNPGQILKSMMQECRVEWLTKGEAALDGSAQEAPHPAEVSA